MVDTPVNLREPLKSNQLSEKLHMTRGPRRYKKQEPKKMRALIRLNPEHLMGSTSAPLAMSWLFNKVRKGDDQDPQQRPGVLKSKGKLARYFFDFDLSLRKKSSYGRLKLLQKGVLMVENSSGGKNCTG